MKSSEGISSRPPWKEVSWGDYLSRAWKRAKVEPLRGGNYLLEMRLGDVMVHFRCHCDWVIGCSDIWLSILSEYESVSG